MEGRTVENCMKCIGGKATARGGSAGRTMHGQVSTEILLLMGLMLALLIPLIMYAFGRANAAQEDFATQRAEFAAQRLARLADSVGYLGGAAAVVDQVDVPPHVKSIRIGGSGHDIVFEMDSTAGRKQIVQTTSFQIHSVGFERITKEGSYFVEVRALSNFTSGADQVGMTVK